MPLTDHNQTILECGRLLGLGRHKSESYAEVAQQIGLTQRTVCRYAKAYRQWYRAEGYIERPFTPGHPAYKALTDFEKQVLAGWWSGEEPRQTCARLSALAGKPHHWFQHYVYIARSNIRSKFNLYGVDDVLPAVLCERAPRTKV